MKNVALKRNQHYVPQFWQKRFGSDGQMWVLDREKFGKRKIDRKGPKNLMSADYLYTIYDARGFGSNVLENWAGRLEDKAAAAMHSLDVAGSIGSDEEQAFLRWFIAFSACRHPDTLGMGHRRSKDLAFALADAKWSNLLDFQIKMKSMGVDSVDAADIYKAIQAIPEDQILEELDDAITRQPNDRALPEQLAIHPETIERVFLTLASFTITILDASAPLHFILGDTPFPPILGEGFTLPLSDSIGLLWEPSGGNAFPDWNRRAATVEEIAKSNRAQADQSLKWLIAPNEVALAPFIPATE